MRRALRIAGWTAAAVLAVPLLLVAALLAALNTTPGQGFAAHHVARLTDGMVVVSGVSGRFPDALRVAHIDVRDARGVWLSVRDAALDWDPWALLHGTAHVRLLSAAGIEVARRPEASAGASAGGGFDLPMRVDVDALRVDRIEVAAAVAGVGAALTAEGNAHAASLRDGTAELALRRLDGPGTYQATARIDAKGLVATLAADEPAHGLAAAIAALPDVGALSLRGSVDGPWSGAALTLAVTAGQLTVSARGRIDIDGRAADLDVSAAAPAMTPRADVSWQSVAVDAHVHGKLAAPQVRGTAKVEGLTASGAAIGLLTATVTGDLGAVGLTARAERVRIPGPRPDLLAGSPVTLQADARLDAAGRPVTFALTHPLLSLHGEARTTGDMRVQAHVDLSDLAPLAAAGGVALQGRSGLDVTASLGAATMLDLTGTLDVTGGLAPLPGLLGPAAKFGAGVTLRGGDLTLSRLAVDGKAVSVAAHGGLRDGAVDLDWEAALTDLSVVAATVQGAVRAHGRVSGPTDALAVQAEATGEVATPGMPRGPIKLTLAAQGLPSAPSGTVRAEGTLDGAPLALDAAVERHDEGALALTIRRADWKSAHAEGALTLPPGAALPSGSVALRMERLDDLRRLLGQPIGGAMEATLSFGDEAGRKSVRVRLSARGAGVAGAGSAGQATLDARVLDPTGDASVDAKLDFAGLRAAGVSGAGSVTAQGRQADLAVRVAATLQGVAGADLAATGAARVDLPGKRAAVSALQATWKGETLRLLAPMRVDFGGGVSADRLRLGLRQAVLEVAGRVSPTLDLTASLRNVSADLARIVAPDLAAEGALLADAKLSGTPARPTGTVRLAATGLRLRSGPGAALPVAAVTADVTLAGATARVQARATAGRTDLTLSGTAPLDPGAAMDLHAAGALDLAALDPLLAVAGRRVRGQVTLDAAITGTPAAPRAVSTLQLAGGEVQDFAQGVHLTDIQALARASGDTVRIERFSGRAGPGTLAASGTVGLGGTMPVDLHVSAKNARPLTSDKLTSTLDMDLTLRGAALGALALGGAITLGHTEIGVPEKLPAKLAVLHVRRPGDKPPQPPAPGPDIALDVELTAPGRVFVRGRGLFAELEGHIHVAGTAAAPRPSGSFKLVRGAFSLPGAALTFTSGEVGFDGSGRLDPTLNFVATSNNGAIVATLTITGYASAPKITLSSTPELPQDEVLAQLLFHQSASSLNGFQLAEAAAALAQISGVGAGMLDPLNGVRRTLGLDRLSVGGSQGGTGASVEAGRYVARGVYVGARQDTSGGGTQAEVQVDLLRGLKLQTTVGTGGATSATGSTATSDPNGTSVGLTYQFNY